MLKLEHNMSLDGGFTLTEFEGVRSVDRNFSGRQLAKLENFELVYIGKY